MYDRIAEALLHAPAPEARAARAIGARARRVLRPSGALERLDEVAAWLASWQRTEYPSITRPALVVFVGDHGVAAEGVSAYPAGVTAAMLAALRDGVATANALAADLGAAVEIVDAGVGRPTGNMTMEPALSLDRFTQAFEAGRAATRRLHADVLVVGEMGIANTTSAAALAACLFGRTAEDWTGPGTGIDDATLRHKIEVVETTRRRVGEAAPFEALRQVGGAEMTAIAGAVLEARVRSIPVLLDGFVVTASAAPLELTRAGALDHCWAGHRSPEPGHALLLEKLGKEPLLDLGLRLGEGSGALAAVPLLRLAARAVTGVATFEERGLET